MKILHVVHSLEPGGMENGIVNMARSLTPRGFEIHVACLKRRGSFAERLPAPDHLALLGKAGGFSPAATWRLARLIGALRPAIVHSHNLGPLIYSALATLGGRRSAIVHGEHSQLAAEDLRPRRLLQRRCFYRASRVVHTVSTPMRDELLRLGFPAQKIVAIPNGVDTTRFRPGDRGAARRALGVPAEALCIGIVARFAPHKRHILLLEAFDEIAPHFPAAHLLVIGGGGSAGPAITARVEASPHRARIHLLGFQDEPRCAVQALDLLAAPSTNEGLSNAVLEAMACGVPALVRAGCGHEEIITAERDGWIQPLENSGALAAALARLLAQPRLLVDFGCAARKKVTEHFSLDSMTAAYERLYRENCAPR